MYHRDILPNDNHIPYAFSYADATARAAGTGFVAADVGKLALQEDDDSLWMLTATTPTWVRVGLNHFTESQTTTAPNATIEFVSLNYVGTAPYDGGLDFKGYSAGSGGAFSLQIPDNTAVGGNKRGKGAIDLAAYRAAAADVASGADSIVIGNSNEASGTSAIAIGRANTASGVTSVAVGDGATASAQDTIAIGNNCSATATGGISIGNSSSSFEVSAVAVGNGAFCDSVSAVAVGDAASGGADYAVSIGASSGVTGIGAVAIGYSAFATGQYSLSFGNDSQDFGVIGKESHAFYIGRSKMVGKLIVSKTTTDATPAIATSNDGATAAGTTNQLTLSNNSVFAFSGKVVARDTTSGDVSAWEFKGAAKRGANAASTAIVGTPTETLLGQDAGASTWDFALSADTTNGAVAVTVTGEAATTIKWTVSFDTLEMINF